MATRNAVPELTGKSLLIQLKDSHPDVFHQLAAHVTAMSEEDHQYCKCCIGLDFSDPNVIASFNRCVTGEQQFTVRLPQDPTVNDHAVISKIRALQGKNCDLFLRTIRLCRNFNAKLFRGLLDPERRLRTAQYICVDQDASAGSRYAVVAGS